MKESIIRTTCDICFSTQRMSDEMPDIGFDFWIKIEELDICPTCTLAVERTNGLHKQIIKKTKKERECVMYDESN